MEIEKVGDGPKCHQTLFSGENSEDEKGEDEKLIAVPSNPVDPSFDDINTLEDLGTLMKKRIFHFFEHYKDIDENKWVKIRGFLDADEAHSIYTKSCNKI